MKWINQKTIILVVGIIAVVFCIYAICTRFETGESDKKPQITRAGAYQGSNFSAIYNKIINDDYSKDAITSNKYRVTNINEIYFRPSHLKVLNNDFLSLDSFEDAFKGGSIPRKHTNTPEDTIISYFSVLQQASNLTEAKSGGCGTVGYALLPYPIAYNFLSPVYKKDYDYDTYLKSFEGIGHINVVNLLPVYTDNNTAVYYLELELLEGSPDNSTAFYYYFGSIKLSNNNGIWQIDSLEIAPEDFFCAPYHGWAHVAETFVDTVFGKWCNMIKKQYSPKMDDYKKTIAIDGNDGKKYMFEFARLTNGTDLLINTYVKNGQNWVPVYIDIEKCLKKQK